VSSKAELSGVGSSPPALSRTSGVVVLAGMLRLTPRATAVVALARREAELLGQPCTSGHVLVVLIWEAGGVAARALSEVGLAKGSEDVVRRWLSGAPQSERGMALDELLHAADKVAGELGHNYLGTEHQLLAIAADDYLGDDAFPADVRELAGAHVRESAR
jgi:Clp amino terminal domain, pathogenicity island component